MADGGENCHINSKVRGLVVKNVNWKIALSSVGGQQLGDDNCVSSVVLIALEYLWIIENGEINERVSSRLA